MHGPVPSYPPQTWKNLPCPTVAGEPALRARLSQLAEKYTEVAGWRRRLAAACAAAGLPPPAPQEAFPLAGGEATVFQVGWQCCAPAAVAALQGGAAALGS